MGTGNGEPSDVRSDNWYSCAETWVDYQTGTYHRAPDVYINCRTQNNYTSPVGRMQHQQADGSLGSWVTPLTMVSGGTDVHVVTCVVDARASSANRFRRQAGVNCFGDTNSNQLNINMSDLQDKNWTQLRNLNSWNEPQYILGNTSTLYGGGILGHDSMNVDDPLVAVNGQAFAVAQGDSNFGIYDENGGMLRAWGTNGYYRTRMFMQTDGNLVLRDAFGTVLWAASWEVGNYMTAGSKVEMQTDGNLVVRRPNGTVFWASNTFS